jgi:hypothetical protein
MVVNDQLERQPQLVELGSSSSRFVMDFATRERGYGKITIGFFDMQLTPVGSPPPPYPDDADYKPAIGVFFWNPPLGELRLETNAATLLRAIAGTWERVRSFKEAAAGLQPVIEFTDRREVTIAKLRKTFWSPVIHIAGWVERDKVPPFALREPTVKPPLALDSQIPFAALPAPRDAVKRGKAPKPVERGALEDLLD